MSDYKYISCTDTAVLIRAELKKNFPGIKFSVRQGSGGGSVNIGWLNGPTEKAVSKVAKFFQGSSFDSSIDLKSYHDTMWNGELVHFGADYVFCNRKHSRAFLEAIIEQFCKRYGKHHHIEVVGKDENAWINARMDYSTEHWLRDLIYSTDEKNMHRAYEAQREQEEQEQREYEAGEPERRRQAEEDRKREEKEEEERQARKKQQERYRQEQQRKYEESRNSYQNTNANKYKNMKPEQLQHLVSREAALRYFQLPFNASEADIKKAFTTKVFYASDGRGNYQMDMDFLVKVKERAMS